MINIDRRSELSRGLVELLDSEGVRLRLEFPIWLRVTTLPGVRGITLGSRIFVDQRRRRLPPAMLTSLILHELVHVRQMRRDGMIRFLWRYVAEYLLGRLAGKPHRQAYLDISYEAEARELSTPSGPVSRWRGTGIELASRDARANEGEKKMHTYKAKTFDLSGLTGISDETLEMHFGLYQGYVTNTNTLNEQIAELARGEVTAAEKPKFSELVRRRNFEYNGMVLHEYYFGNMKKDASGEPDSGNGFRSAVENSFDGFDAFTREFATIGSMRGIGWVICYQDVTNGALSNHWINEHEDGNIAGFTPILIMDVWEHAFIRDYKPSEKGKYIESFMANVDWDVVAGRLREPDPNAR